VYDHLSERETRDEVDAFNLFIRRNVADGVHSGSGRTGPKQEDTDFYPVPLTREALRPGTLFADPYGHLLVVAKWIPQGVNGYGVLLGADAQPDGTVGRRRFWRGSFLFHNNTAVAGAGFKGYRPVRSTGSEVRSVKNRDIGDSHGAPPFSMEQYELGTDGFYDRMEALINPRPLDPRAMMSTLVDALNESVQRRVNSVQNGEDHKKTHRGAIKMPHGHSIFETSGAWENFSTPSRDMRLLIAIDTVMGFPDKVKRNPERYGTTADKADGLVADLRAALDRELAARSLEYLRSDGSKQPLTVKDVVDRAKDFEMAYNPNDCVEIRWAAPEGSDERSTCRTHAPAGQRALMRKYREWFATRTRPAR
jgi:hypothetical protein